MYMHVQYTFVCGLSVYRDSNIQPKIYRHLFNEGLACIHVAFGEYKGSELCATLKLTFQGNPRPTVKKFFYYYLLYHGSPDKMKLQTVWSFILSVFSTSGITGPCTNRRWSYTFWSSCSQAETLTHGTDMHIYRLASWETLQVFLGRDLVHVLVLLNQVKKIFFHRS